MRDAWRHMIAEFVGTFALVFVGSGAIIMSRMPDSNIGLVEVALAHGIILMVMVSATMRISGHFNPAVTLGFLVTRRIDGMMAGLYIVAQLLGGIAAAFVLRATMPGAAFDAARGGGQAVSIDITSGQALTLEAIATFFLVFVVFGTAVDPRAPKIGGIAIGLTIAADILAIGPLTGASMNPARSFGPAFATQIWEGQLIYWLGPLIGGALAAVVYERFLIRHPVEPVDHGAIKPVG
jgi:MIP family channel proteins